MCMVNGDVADHIPHLDQWAGVTGALGDTSTGSRRRRGLALSFGFTDAPCFDLSHINYPLQERVCVCVGRWAGGVGGEMRLMRVCGLWTSKQTHLVNGDREKQQVTLPEWRKDLIDKQIDRFKWAMDCKMKTCLTVANSKEKRQTKRERGGGVWTVVWWGVITKARS